MPQTKSEPEALPPIPRIAIDKIRVLAHDLEQMFMFRLDETVTDALAVYWADQLALTLDYCGDLKRYRDTMLQYTGSKVTLAFCKRVSLQLAARQDELRKGPIIYFQRPTKAEWVPLEIQSLQTCMWHSKAGDRAGIEFVMLALGGHPAGHLLRRKFPLAWLGFMARKVGFGRRVQWDDEPQHFLGLRFFGFLKPREDSTDLEFSDWEVPPKLRKYNYQIIKLRTRFDYELAECPRNLQHYCWQCPHKRSQCMASTQLD